MREDRSFGVLESRSVIEPKRTEGGWGRRGPRVRWGIGTEVGDRMEVRRKRANRWEDL